MVVINLFPKSARLCECNAFGQQASKARLAQSAERKALNLVVVGRISTIEKAGSTLRSSRTVPYPSTESVPIARIRGWRLQISVKQQLQSL